MSGTLDGLLLPALERLRAAGRFRSPRAVSTGPGARTVVEGRPVANFASNNYLDLAGDTRVVAAATRAAEEWGTGATGSRLLGGGLAIHRALEAALASHKGVPAAAVFPTGYQANVGALTALLGPTDTVVLDRLAHASLVDGARLSRARLRVFAHNDPLDLDRVLSRVGGAWVVVESVYSMDGDRAPLREIHEVCRERGARLYVDEAHATGVWGPEGRGAVNDAGLAETVDVCMGTLSKALGAQGGFVAGSSALIDWLQNKARAYIYSTALTPSAAAAALEALRIAREDAPRRARLFALADRLRRGLGVSGGGPIVPVIVGAEADALDLSSALWSDGIFAPAVRPPTVPMGTARVRFSVTAGHTEGDIDRALAVVHRWRARRGAATA